MASIPVSSLERSLRTWVEWDDHGCVVVRLAGELDLSAEAELERQLREVIWESPREIVLDLRGLTFIDSTGISLLLRMWQWCTREGYHLVCVPSRDRRVLQTLAVTGVDRALRMHAADMS